MKPKLLTTAMYIKACPRCTGTVRLEAIPHEDETALVCYACGWRRESVHNQPGRRSYTEHVPVVDAYGAYR